MGFRVGPGTDGPGSVGPGTDGPGNDGPGRVGPGTDGPGSVVIPLPTADAKNEDMDKFYSDRQQENHRTHKKYDGRLQRQGWNWR